MRQKKARLSFMRNVFAMLAAAWLPALVTTGCSTASPTPRDEALAVARVMAADAAAMLVFKEPKDATQMVSSISKSRELAFAAVLDANARVFAEYFQPYEAVDRAELLDFVRRARAGGEESLLEHRGVGIAIVPIRADQGELGSVVVGAKLRGNLQAK